MLKKNAAAPSFAETLMEKRLNQNSPLLKLLRAVDWEPLRRKLEKLYYADAGRPARRHDARRLPQAPRGGGRRGVGVSLVHERDGAQGADGEGGDAH
jgi:hypothetical protein